MRSSLGGVWMIMFYVELVSVLLLFSLSDASSPSHHRLLSVVAGGDGEEVGSPINHQNAGGRQLLVKYEPDVKLAQGRTRRKDPANKFKLYEGGWNISDIHYQLTVAFIGLPFYIIGVVWFYLFAIIWCVSLFCLTCCKGKGQAGGGGKTQTCENFSLFALSILTLVAIGGAIVVFWSEIQFHNTTKEAVVYLRNQSDEAAGNLNQVYTYLRKAGNVSLGDDEYNLPKDTRQDIRDSYWRYSSSVNKITKHSTTTDYIHKILHDVLPTIQWNLLTSTTIALILIFVGFAASHHGSLLAVYILAVLGWVLLFNTIMWSGLDVALYNEIGDTCLAMEEWVQKGPLQGTAMDELITCSNVKNELQQTKMVTQQLITAIDNAIDNIANNNNARRRRHHHPDHKSSSNDIPFLPLLCNPYYPDLSRRDCEHGEVHFTNATQIWNNYVCNQVGADGRTCMTKGRLTPNLYTQLTHALTLTTYLHNKYTPLLSELDACDNLEKALDHISCHYCPSIIKFSMMMVIGVPILSAALMFSMFIWLDYTKKRKSRHHGHYNYHQPPPTTSTTSTAAPARHSSTAPPTNNPAPFHV